VTDPNTNGTDIVDLDAALAERRAARTPLRVRMFGRLWELPGVAPAAAIIRLYRWDQKGWVADDGDVSDTVPQAELLDFLLELVPGDVYEGWTAAGLDIDDVEPAITAIMAAYGDRLRPRAEGEAKAPKGRGRASRTSSNGGRSSKPTSRGNTASRTSGKS
jgi:hypothetical protein